MAIHPVEFRYGTPEMRVIWEAENKLQKMLDVEAALAQAEGELGIIPAEAASEIVRKASTEFVTLERVNEIERDTKHDIASLVKALAEQCEGDAGEYVHFGATSNDIVDTSNSLLLRDSISVLRDKLTRVLEVLLALADENRDRVCIGRTHGQHALPTTYGMKFAIWADEIHRQLERLDACSERLCVGMMTGAVGTTAALGEEGLEVHERVSEILGLRPVLISNQVVQRDNHAEFIMVLANIATTLDKIALEIRNLQRTEIMEVGEKFDPEKQVGSSTMPHKMNPITAERICGIARVIRSYVVAALENNPLWHERDLTNSSSERIILPEACILTDYILKLTLDVLCNLVFYPENIKRNLEFTGGLIMAERLMAELTRRGMGRQTAYAAVRQCAIEASRTGRSLRDVVLERSEIMDYLTVEDLEEIMNPETYIGSARRMVERVLEESQKWL
ncbi:adenylosuccinate lyase [Methanothermobacter thermautotrophicus str. Delta H]|uniref:Adenylosuccinate lyase n=1 Tax=Methanothermobacter thermautotrophicus (strain ATCC 29096 / DSM 1053 / JCM 10044 / NBRC 100330 / Delta H) TaxID=187420 RepID=PUR8_METTH|nr:adenylosuccinate lyase [Methanothermobacter thermautotrophicus]O27580.1 RecName: Full=Adenylosuccinate lyase; Short=ASL; AltName: Full=Adenylosuccinase; Short=ASase [Methanothermobacter thermautotrophicus str. Delta H]AAB86011.1 adenylosuccinate lyase [Methanothermobacter thermautotrophicus str. Delta H]MDI6818101.1 adenylosuccinate lyase [Methanothermobacter thermautotrophicus]WBF06036.1 adenylosuccinate lyase [Methanothermobacter thermautotrophicus]